MLSISAAVLNNVYDALLIGSVISLLKILILMKLTESSHLFISLLGIAFIKYSDSFQRFYREKCYHRDFGKFQNLWYVHILLSAYIIGDKEAKLSFWLSLC